MMPEESEVSTSLEEPMSPEKNDDTSNKRQCLTSIDRSIIDKLDLTETDKSLDSKPSKEKSEETSMDSKLLLEKNDKCTDSNPLIENISDISVANINVEIQKIVEKKAAENADANSKIDYHHATEYWNNVPATVNGMLGGFAHISSTDIVGSEAFLKWIFSRKVKPGRARCIDCGAGIGRITQGLLQRHFGVVDMVEQSSVFTDTAREKFAENPKVGNIYCSGLQDFIPEENIYDVVWIQWVLPYLPDEALVDFLKRMSKSLKKDGILCIKENVTSGVENNPKDYVLDEEDLSVTRPVEQFIELANKADLKLIRSIQQQKFPKQLFKVYMLAFKPEKYHNCE